MKLDAKNLEVLTGTNLMTFLLVLVALAGLFILFANVVESARKLRKPKDKEEADLATRVTECDRRFKSDLDAIRSLEKRTTALEEGQRVQCAGVHALLEHELHNGNAAEMQEASRALFDHLNNKR